MNTLSRFFFRTWRPAVLVLSISLIAYLLYFRALGSLLPNYSQPESASLATAANWHTIATNPVNAPYRLAVWLLTAVSHHGILMTRAVAASFGVLAVLTFYSIIHRWYGFRVVFLSTLLFATSAGLLHTARLGTPQILQMGVLAFIAIVLAARRSKHHRIIIGYGAAALLAVLWYIPGMIWFELFGFVLLWDGLRRQLWRLSPIHIASWGVIFAGIIAPLVIACVRNPHLLLTVSGLPGSVDTVSHIASNLWNALMSIGVRSDGNPLLWVGHAPLLTAVELALGAIGAYFYLFQERSLQAVLLIGSVAISLVLIGLGGSVGFASLVPLLYLFIAHGLNHFQSRWLTVFPRNPIAKFTGIAIICVMLFFSVLYQVRSYFVAWPHDTATRQAFDLREP